MTDLKSLRDKIDGLDQKLVWLLEERMEFSRRVGAYKAAHNLPVLDEEREKDVLQSRAAMVRNKANEQAVLEILRLVMRLSRESQESGK